MQDDHRQLLREVGPDSAMEDKRGRIINFIRRAAATGGILSAEDDRAAAQALINFWAGRLARMSDQASKSTSVISEQLEFEDTLLKQFDPEALIPATVRTDDWIRTLSPDDQAFARRLMLRLARLAPDGTTYEPVPVSRAALHDMAPSAQKVDEIIDGLNVAGVIRVAKRGAPNADMVELKGRSLLESWPAYAGWLEERRKFRETAQQTVNELQLAERAAKYLQGDKSALLDEKDTKKAEELRESDYVRDPALLTLEIAQLIDRSRLHWVNEDKRRLRHQSRWLIGFVFVLIGLVVGLAVVSVIAIRFASLANSEAKNAWEEEEKALAAERAAEAASAKLKDANALLKTIATSIRLAAQATSYRKEQPDLGALLSLEALGTIDIPEARSSLLSVLEANLRPITFLRAHTSTVTGVAFSPNGKVLASSEYSGKILLWEFASGRLLDRPLEGHQGCVTGLAFSFDGKLLASSGDDGTIRLWDAATHKAVGGLRPDGHRGLVRSIAFHPKRNVLAFSDINGDIFLWEIARPPPLGAPFAGLKAIVTSVAFSPDGKLLAAGLERQTVRLWDVDTGKPLDLTRPTSRLQHADELKEKLPWLWPAGPPPDDFVTCVAFGSAKEGSLLAAGGSDGTVLLWDIASRPPRGDPLNTRAKYVTGVAFSPDGKVLASGDIHGTISLWDVDSRQLLGESRMGREAVNGVAFSPDAKTLASASRDGNVALWDLTAHMPLRPNYDLKDISSSALSRDGKTAASGTSTGTILLWNLDSQKPLGPILGGHAGKVTAVAFSPDGKLLASGGENRTVRLYDVATCKFLQQLLGGPEDKDAVAGLAFSLDGKSLAVGTGDGTFVVWSVAEQQVPGRRCCFEGPDYGPITSVTISPDGKLLAAANSDSAIRLWNVASGPSGQLLGPPLLGHHGPVNSLVFSHDSELLASGSDDGDVRLWNVATREPTGLPMRGHWGSVKAVAFSPTSRLLASGSSDETLRLWDVASASINVTAKRMSGSSDETRRLWDVASRPQLGPPLVGHRDQVSVLSFHSDSPDALVLLSGSAAGAVLRWDVGAKSCLARARRLASRNFEWDEWQQFKKGERYHKTCPEAPIPRSVIDGNLAKGKSLASSAPDEASAAYAEAAQLALQTEDAELNNKICWEGSLDGFGREVLAAGERAVRLEPDRPEFHDTWGLARALTGDRAGAIEHFTFYVKNYNGEPSLLEQREKWLQDLQAGRNPFTKETLAALRRGSVEP
jgi:WD40 repeat protein